MYRQGEDPPAILELNDKPPEGACFLLATKKDKSTDFKKTNPFALAREVDARRDGFIDQEDDEYRRHSWFPTLLQRPSARRST